MDNEHELPPEDLDALLNDLQKGMPPTLPGAQQQEGDFLSKLVSAAHGAQLDEGYASRLEKHLTHGPARTCSSVPAQEWMLPARPQQPMRRMTLAITSIALVMVLGMSSMMGSRLPQASVAPSLPLLESASSGVYTGYTASPRQTSVFSSPQAQPGEDGGTLSVQAIQAPDPPHTPLPGHNALDATPLGH